MRDISGGVCYTQGEVNSMRDIGKNIRDLRLRCGLSQEQLAERLFVTRQTISNYENSRTRPDVEQILRLAEAFGTDANSVLYGPPQDAEKRNAIITTALSMCLTAALWLGYVLLSRRAYLIQTNSYNVLPRFAVEHCWLPIALAVSGWALVQLVSLAVTIRPAKSAAVRWAGYALMGCVLLPVAACGLLAIAAHWMDTAPLGQLLTWAYMPRLSYAFSTAGAAMRLLGFPGIVLRGHSSVN